MGTKSILVITACLLVLGCSTGQQCDVQRLMASKPSRSVESEGGRVDVWDHNAAEFKCTGLITMRGIIHPGGLLIPSYTAAPYLTFIHQGSGIQSMIMPGCSETFESGSGSESESEKDDEYQKVFRIREGDIMAAPAGVVQWTHNDGDTDLIRITVIHATSIHNQLDQINPRSFFLSGRRHGLDTNEAWTGGLLRGFDDETLHEIFGGAELETIKKLRGKSDTRGSIIHAGNLNIHTPEDERNTQTRHNGVLDCSLKFKHSLDNPAHADVFVRGAGRINTVDAKSLPILSSLGMCAQHFVLNKGAMIGPRWNLNAHSTVYIRKGEGRAQVVGDVGNTVFDDQVKSGQILGVPQGFALAMKAGDEGVEWMEVKTNHNAVTSSISGRTSVLRAIPAKVLASSYDISIKEAMKLKSARREVEVFRPFDSGLNL